EADVVDSGEGSEPPDQVTHLHYSLAAVPLQWAVQCQWASRVPLGRGLPQQHHKSVFKPCLDRGNHDASERASLWWTTAPLSVLCLDEPHATALWHCVDHSWGVEQARLQPARRLPSVGLSQECAAGRQLSDSRGSTLRQHPALMQDNYVLA